MLLASGRQLDGAVAQLLAGDRLGFLGDRCVVYAGAAATDQPPRLGVAGRQAGEGEQAEGRDAGLQLRGRDGDGGQGLRGLTLLEGAAGGFGGLDGLIDAMQQRGGFGGQALLRLIDLGAA